MSATTTHSLPYDPATVEFDPLLRRLNLANTRRRWSELLERAETQGWSCREFLGVVITVEIAQRQQTRIRRSVKQVRFPFLTVEEFDFSFQSSAALLTGQLSGPRAGQRRPQPGPARQERPRYWSSPSLTALSRMATPLASSPPRC